MNIAHPAVDLVETLQTVDWSETLGMSMIQEEHYARNEEQDNVQPETLFLLDGLVKSPIHLAFDLKR